MTKREALRIFRTQVLPAVIVQYGPKDAPARCEAWNDWTDALCKDRQITLRQYESWTNPF